MRKLLAMFCLIASGALGGCARQSAATSTAITRQDPDLITTAEIDAGNFRSAYDVVQRLRPTWFSRASTAATRTMSIEISPTGAGAQTGGGAGLVVYLDNSRMGGTDALRDLMPSGIQSLQFMDAATATARLPGIGSSVISGAIVATSRVGR